MFMFMCCAVLCYAAPSPRELRFSFCPSPEVFEEDSGNTSNASDLEMEVASFEYAPAMTIHKFKTMQDRRVPVLIKCKLSISRPGDVLRNVLMGFTLCSPLEWVGSHRCASVITS